MSNEAPVRRLLPQSSQMASFSFATPVYQQPRETQKNYVFVDEHNRHKRLKVMRACEGCRRRKIKCDAATTNTWPCSACIRLKLHCMRPNGFEGSSEPSVYEPARPQFEPSHIQDGFRQQLPLHDQQLLASAQKPVAIYPSTSAYADSSNLGYHASQYAAATVSQGMHYTTLPPTSMNMMDSHYPQHSFPTPPMQHGQCPDPASEVYDTHDQYGQLSDLLGSLKVDEAGTAPYLNKKTRARLDEEEPPTEDTEEFKSMLPPLATGPGLRVRIPPELMPDEETMMQYFELYFAHAHQYVPVLDKEQFYHQWQTTRDSISPLLIEAIFAVAGRLADEAAQGQQWLALATRHADSFMDVPRLSTLQALLILLKAREQAPKRGYYYRSWMSIVQCVQMGKDLGLDEHFADHRANRPCEYSLHECQLKTRIWQCIFVCEVMIGSPQSRTDLQVEIGSVNFETRNMKTMENEDEFAISRNFTYLARVVRNIARMNTVYGRIRKTKDWGIDPEFVQIKPELNNWLSELPHDLEVNYPADGSMPWLPTPFLGNLHSYYYLSIILFNRPQLASLNPSSADGQWKVHMTTSYNAAKVLCRLQEAVMHYFGLPGLQSMQRGINFTIYAVLSCIVLHLVALTSPDEDLNRDAREYFTRHMRILEACMAAWPMPDMQRQVDSVREAFSANTRKPFVLKQSFPYGSPHSAARSSPPRSQQPLLQPGMGRTGSLDQHMDTRSGSFSSHHPISPPFSAGTVENKGGSPALPSALAMMAAPGTQAPLMPQSVSMTGGPSAWNPSRIFDQWNTSFGTPPAPALPPPPSSSSPPVPLLSSAARTSPHASSSSSPGAAEVPTVQDIQAVHAQLPPGAQPISYSAAPHVPTFITPTMWQESVASAYEGGLKRSWDFDSQQMMKRPV